MATYKHFYFEDAKGEPFRITCEASVATDSFDFKTAPAFFMLLKDALACRMIRHAMSDSRPGSSTADREVSVVVVNGSISMWMTRFAKPGYYTLSFSRGLNNGVPLYLLGNVVVEVPSDRPYSMEDVRQFAERCFRTQNRATGYIIGRPRFNHTVRTSRMSAVASDGLRGWAQNVGDNLLCSAELN